MGRKPSKSADEKLHVVLTVLRGEMTQVEIARQLQMSQTTIAKWQKQFLEGGHQAFSRGDNPKPAATSRQAAEMQEKIDELTQALGEAYVELRVWRKRGALYPRSRSYRQSGSRPG